MRILLTFTLFTFVFSTCQPVEKRQHTDSYAEAEQIPLRYAKRFQVQKYQQAYLLEVNQASDTFRYVLASAQEEIPDTWKNFTRISTPLQSVVCTSTSHLPALEYLGVAHTLVGFPQSVFICSPLIRQRIDSGKVQELGQREGINLEKLTLLQPEVLIGFSMGNESNTLKKIEDLGIPVIRNADFLEDSPLARAEWIKFFGLLYGKSEEADSIFQVIDSTYQSLLSLTKEIKERPTVYSGVVYGDIWYTPGGKSWAAHFFKDAGANYLWQDTDGQGSLSLSFEAVLAKAHQADYWVGVASFSSLQEIRETEPRYADFAAFKNQQVYSYNKRMGATGGNDYLETGYLRPDWILADLIYIFHPELLPAHQSYFYQELR
ncbi:ABC transporter substrate-binding protein [Cytophagales bacterium LB-30]|uniref:ABC transporter substrate-binding protein n=1 Tax=Shiella aurantiaca TaxID=3058365 RepID=A0ABT8F7D0_9BACT|nr:ABC transporter substrate-binding protein [Shiella aurantiaca]MDN4166295.1 ABC transporter substrate-binding protein [Shiella aurantiaca]